MAHAPTMSTSLKTSPSHRLRCDILEAFWKLGRAGIPDTLYIKKYEQYFDEYYTDEIKAMYESGIESLASKMAATTHQHVIDIADILWHNQKHAKAQIIQQLQKTLFPGQEARRIGHAVDFVLRLWLMINVKDLGDGGAWIFGEAEPGVWDDDSTLEGFVRNRFPKEAVLGEETLNIALRDDFTAANLQRIGGFKITWTRNIEDHLSMSRDNEGTRTVNVFPYRSCLEAQLRCKVPISEKLLKETITSLDVLFPSFDTRTQAFLREEKRSQLSTGTSSRQGTRYIRDFQTWKQRMAELYLEYKDQPGRPWSDRRNPREWIVFVSTIAGVLLAVAFGVISIVTACLSTRYAMLSYELALQQATTSPASGKGCVVVCPAQDVGISVDQRDSIRVVRAQELRV